jgi:flagellin-like protein
MKKRGVSPVIATVLLVAMVIVIALIIFLWFKGLSGEIITKFGGTNIELVCGDVEFFSDYNNGQLSITNNGNVPIFGMKVKVEGGGEHKTMDIRNIANWPDTGLGQGGSFSANVGDDVGYSGTLTLTPVLLGTSDKGERAYMCNEGQHGSEIEIY